MTASTRIVGFRVAGDPRQLDELLSLWGDDSVLPLPEPVPEAFEARRCELSGGWRFSPCTPAAARPAQLDILTQQLEAEANRLEELGARRIGHVRGRMWLLETPGGERLRILAA
jgi:hypothetical protein